MARVSYFAGKEQELEAQEKAISQLQDPAAKLAAAENFKKKLESLYDYDKVTEDIKVGTSIGRAVGAVLGTASVLSIQALAVTFVPPVAVPLAVIFLIVALGGLSSGLGVLGSASLGAAIGQRVAAAKFGLAQKGGVAFLDKAKALRDKMTQTITKLEVSKFVREKLSQAPVFQNDATLREAFPSIARDLAKNQAIVSAAHRHAANNPAAVPTP
jgi:hypothetical protein